MEIVRCKGGRPLKEGNKEVKAPCDFDGDDLFEIYILPFLIFHRATITQELKMRKAMRRAYTNGKASEYMKKMRYQKKYEELIKEGKKTA